MMVISGWKRLVVAGLVLAGVLLPGWVLAAGVGGAGWDAGGVDAREVREVRADGGIRAVTLYPDGARVERVWAFDVEVGGGFLELPLLSARVDARSVQVAVTGVEGFRLGQVESRVVEAVEWTHPRERELQDERLRLLDEQRGHEDVRRAHALRLRFIEGLAGSGEARVSELPLERWEEAWDRVGAGAAAVLAEMQDVDRQLRAISGELDRVERDLNRFRTERRDQLGLRVHYSSAEAGSVHLRLVYDVADASWLPSHEARLDTVSGELALLQFATVRQNTGEDWEDVELRLAHARPRVGGVIPSLDPRYLDIRPDGVQTRMLSESVPASAPMAADAMRSDVVVEVSGWSRLYRLPGRVDLASDNREQRLELSEERVPAAVALRVVPLRSPFAHVVATATWPESASPLLPGRIVLVQDGQRVGESRIPSVAPGSRLELGFGVDDSLVVERIENPHLDAQRGLIRRDNQQERGFLIRVTNGADSERSVLIVDRVPVPRDERIQVVRDRANPRPDQEGFGDIPGLLAWERRLAPGAMTEIRWLYTVTWPVGESLLGLY
jgi:uncharacterized protein (TIGR02231 family)